jgi:hypothetical protein
MDRRLLLQAARPDRFDVELDPGCMGPRIELVGKHFLMPESKRVLLGLIADRPNPLRGARLVHDAREHAGEHKCRHCGDEDQNGCVGSDIGPLGR